jgi:hypothetical protein
MTRRTWTAGRVLVEQHRIERGDCFLWGYSWVQVYAVDGAGEGAFVGPQWYGVPERFVVISTPSGPLPLKGIAHREYPGGLTPPYGWVRLAALLDPIRVVMTPDLETALGQIADGWMGDPHG